MSTTLQRRAEQSAPAFRAYCAWDAVIGQNHGLRPARPWSYVVDRLLNNLKTIGALGSEDELKAAMQLYADEVVLFPTLPGFIARSSELLRTVRGLDQAPHLDVKRSPTEEPLPHDAVVGQGLVHTGVAGWPATFASTREP